VSDEPARPRTVAVSLQGELVDAYPELAPEALRGTPRRVTVVGEDVLRRRCGPVTEFGTPELSALVDDLFATMYVAEGVGLAANQIAVGLRVFIYDCPDDAGVRHVGHVVNPVLDKLGRDERRLATDGEGCLSVPGPVKDVARPGRARVRGVDLHGRPVVVEGGGYFARCLQHEVDHLDGRLYVDQLSRRERKDVLAQMEEMRDEVAARRAARAAELGLPAGPHDRPPA
jgi:peptide deformylase